MEEFINMIADKFGIDRDRATEIAKQLQAKGQNLPELAKDGITIQELQGLLGDNKELLAGIPGVGGLIGGLIGGQAVAEIPTRDARPPMQENPVGKDPR